MENDTWDLGSPKSDDGVVRGNKHDNHDESVTNTLSQDH